MRALAILVLALLPAAAVAAETVTFGVQMAPENTTVDEIVRTAKLVEELGYDHFWLNDHFVPVGGDRDGANFESWTLLSLVAVETTRIRIGILVSGNTYRHPALLAKMATTVDHLSGGRLEFGIGAGWEKFEHEAFGVPFETAKIRTERLAESLEVITRLWRDERPSFGGKYYSLAEAPFSPKPIQKPHPPIVIGGQGKKWIMPLVGRYADEWSASPGVTPEGIRERVALIRAECRRAGRRSCIRRLSVFMPLANITNVPFAGPLTRLGARLLVDERVARSVLAGSAKQIQDQIREYLDAGVTSVIITTRPGIHHDRMRRFATEVIPGLRTRR